MFIGNIVCLKYRSYFRFVLYPRARDSKLSTEIYDAVRRTYKHTHGKMYLGTVAMAFKGNRATRSLTRGRLNRKTITSV